MYFLDTNVIIRFLTGDDPEKQAAVAALFERIDNGEVSVFLPDVVIAEVVYVLSSPRLYHLPRQEIAELLTPLLQHFYIDQQAPAVQARALRIYADTKDLDYEDAYIVAAMEHAEETRLFSYDTGYDQFPFIQREEPATPEKAAA